MICRRCLHLFQPAEAVAVSSRADVLYDGVAMAGMSVHENREICRANLSSYNKVEEKNGRFQSKSMKTGRK